MGFENYLANIVKNFMKAIGGACLMVVGGIVGWQGVKVSNDAAMAIIMIIALAIFFVGMILMKYASARNDVDMVRDVDSDVYFVHQR